MCKKTTSKLFQHISSRIYSVAISILLQVMSLFRYFKSLPLKMTDKLMTVLIQGSHFSCFSLNSGFLLLKDNFPAIFSPLKYFQSSHSCNVVLIKTAHCSTLIFFSRNHVNYNQVISIISGRLY